MVEKVGNARLAGASSGVSMASQHLPMEGIPREEIHFLHSQTPSAIEAQLAVGQAGVCCEAQPAPSSLEQPIEQLTGNRVPVIANLHTVEEVEG